jgi:cytochrome P450
MIRQKLLIPPLPTEPVDMMQFWQRPFETIEKLHERYGPIVLMSPDEPQAIAVTSAAGAQEFFTRPDVFSLRLLKFHPPENTPIYRLVYGLGSMNHIDHPLRRPSFVSFFRRDTVRKALDQLTAQIDAYFDTLELNKTYDAVTLLQHLMGKVTMNSFFSGFSDDTIYSYWKETELWVTRCSRFDIEVTEEIDPSTPYGALMEISERVEARYRAAIAEERQNPGTHPLLHMLVSMVINGQPISDDEVVGHMNIVVSGSSSAAYALAWAIFFLTQYPHYSAMMREEINRVCGDAPVTIQHLDAFDLSMRVLKESARLMPVASVFIRKALDDTSICQYEVRKDTMLFCSAYTLHRQPSVFPEPRRFRPERWIGLTPPPFTYIPFGAGVHQCAGMRWSQLVMRLVLSRLIQRFSFDLEPGSEVGWKQLVSVVPTGLNIRLKPPSEPFVLNRTGGVMRDLVDFDEPL